MTRSDTLKIAYTGILTALCAVFALFISVPTMGGHTNLCDVIIFTSSMLLGPLPSFIVGGLGTFLADILHGIPLTAIFSLLFHGLEGLLSSLLIRKAFKIIKKSFIKEGLSFLISGILMIIGYFFAKAFVYGTLESALISLWKNMLQVALSITITLIIMYPLQFKKIVEKINF